MEEADSYEEQNVHAVYEEIASHFSSTRYKPWPLIERFLLSLPPGAIGVDIGCGNGKYLPVNRNIFIVASDRSRNLVQIARQHAPHSALVADCLDIPHPPGVFDFAISIAVIHHLSTRDRRVAAVRAILNLLRSTPGSASAASAPPAAGPGGGRALLYVWALEQKSSRRGWDDGDSQDVMVPWVLKSKGQPEKTFQRYYHLYRAGELKEDIVAAGGRVVEEGYERDNWWAIAEAVDVA